MYVCILFLEIMHKVNAYFSNKNPDFVSFPASWTLAIEQFCALNRKPVFKSIVPKIPAL